MNQPIKTAVIGYGLSGKVFHAPFLSQMSEFELSAIVSSRPEVVRDDFPTVSVLPRLDDVLIDDSIELVINATPNPHHFNYTKKILEAGKNVLVEKPMCITFKQCSELETVSKETGKVLSVFQNRRWDSDFLTVKRVIESKSLGNIRLFEAHWDRYAPEVKSEKWRERDEPGSGILFDLGSHLIDQVLQLFGPPESILADVQMRKGTQHVVNYYHLVLGYGDTRVIVHGDSFGDTSPRFRIHGEGASFIKYGLDPQESQLKSGMEISNSQFGTESNSTFGKFITYKGRSKSEEVVASEVGRYSDFYRKLFECIRFGKKNPVKANEAAEVIRVIELSLESSRSGKELKLN